VGDLSPFEDSPAVALDGEVAGLVVLDHQRELNMMARGTSMEFFLKNGCGRTVQLLI
jgi:hypothetical protein